jgi:hypothetical protein
VVVARIVCAGDVRLQTMEERTLECDPWSYPPPDVWGCDAPSFRWLQPGELIDIPVPTAALELDALLRHLEIDGDFRDWGKAASHLAEARAVWRQIEVPLGCRLQARRHLGNAVVAARETANLLGLLEDAVVRGAGAELAGLARRAIVHVETIERALE